MEVAEISAVIAHIYKAAAEPDGWQRLAPELARSFRAHSCAMIGWDIRSGETLLASATADFTAGLMAEYMVHYRAQDLWLMNGLKVPRGVPAVGAELVDEAVLLRSEFYNDYLTRLSHFDVLGGSIGDGRVHEAFAAVHRSRHAPRFDTADKREMAMLMPHLTQAMRLHLRLAGSHRRGVIAAAALDLMPGGVLAVEADRTVSFANSAAERLLSIGAGITVRRGRLHCTDGDADRALGRLLREAVAASGGRIGGAGGVSTAPRPEQRPLSLLICPLAVIATDLRTAPAALVFVGDPDARVPATTETLVRLYGLTPAEARLSGALLAGDSLQDYAARANLSLHTVRVQLKQVFAKTGTGRQAELVSELLGNPVLGLRLGTH